MSSLVFWDPVCAQLYDSQSPDHAPMGGSESSLARVADAVGAYVIQHNRTIRSGRYCPPIRLDGIQDVIVNRDPRAFAKAKALYPHARLHLWLHDRIEPGSSRGRVLKSLAPTLIDSSVSLICVSNTQRLAVEATLGPTFAPRLAMRTIYNPIADCLGPVATSFDPNKLVFFSSPNKGLAYTLDAFSQLRRKIPDLRLLVANPGYKLFNAAPIVGVTWLGALPQTDIHREVRGALCTFCPNFVLPETFGLVFAESLALGTPVLTHDCGAALEVIADSRQVLAVTAWQRLYERTVHGLPLRIRRTPARVAGKLGVFDDYVQTIAAWRSGQRPKVAADPRFELATIANQWRTLLS